MAYVVSPLALQSLVGDGRTPNERTKMNGAVSETGKGEWKYQVRYSATVFVTKDEGACYSPSFQQFLILAPAATFFFF